MVYPETNIILYDSYIFIKNLKSDFSSSPKLYSLYVAQLGLKPRSNQLQSSCFNHQLC